MSRMDLSVTCAWRTTGKGRKQYLHEMDDAAHAELLDVALAHKGSVILSGYDNPLYNDRLSEWHREERICYSQAASKKKEILWMNFEPDREGEG